MEWSTIAVSHPIKKKKKKKIAVSHKRNIQVNSCAHFTTFDLITLGEVQIILLALDADENCLDNLRADLRS